VYERTTSAAPGELELVRRFVNTLDIEQGTDELATPETAARWLAAAGFGFAPSRGRLRTLVSLREAIRDLVSERGSPGERAAAETLDRIAVGSPLRVRISGGGSLPLAPAREGVEGFVGGVLAIVAASIIDGSWDRLKACPNDRCRWLFYDNSRNRSRTWCSMDVCGSRAKMRAYRSRKRTAEARSTR